MNIPKPGLLSFVLADGPIRDWGMSLAVLLFVWIVLQVIKKYVLIRLKRLAERTSNDFDDAVIDILNGISQAFYVAAAVFAASMAAPLPDAAANAVRIVFIAVTAVESVRAGSALTRYSVYKYMKLAPAAAGDGSPNADSIQKSAVASASSAWLERANCRPNCKRLAACSRCRRPPMLSSTPGLATGSCSSE